MTLRCEIESIYWKWVCNFEDVTWKAKQNSAQKAEAMLMRNGTGKTTTLKLIQYLLTNTELKKDMAYRDDDDDAPEPNQILARARYKGLASSKEIDREDCGLGEFGITISVNDEPYTLMWKFNPDYSEGVIHTQTPSGYRDRYQMPDAFEKAFKGNLEFARLLFLDSQDAGTQGRRLKKDVIDDMLKTLSNVKTLDYTRRETIPSLIAEQSKKENRTGSAAELDSAEKALEAINSQIVEIKNKLFADNKTLEQNLDEIKDIEKSLEDLREQGNLREEHERLKGDAKMAHNRVKTHAKELLNALIDPSNLPSELWKPMKDYYAKLASSRIPKSIAKEWVRSIKDEKICICGRPLHDEELRCLDEKMQSSMGLGILSEVYIMKDMIASSEPSKDIITLKRNLENEITEREKARSDLESLDSQLNSKVKGTVEELSARKATLESENEELRERIEIAECVDDGTIMANRAEWLGRSIRGSPPKPAEGRGAVRECKNLKWAYAVRDNLTKKMATIAGITDFTKAGDVLSELFEEVENAVLDYLRKELIVSTNEHLGTYNMQNELRVSSMDNGITLEDAEGNPQIGFSTGEEMSIIFSFVEAISNLTQVEVPMIVDNPTKGLGNDKCRGVEQSLQSYNNQVVLFVFDTERPRLNNYLIEETVNPSVFIREHEDPAGNVASGKKGTYRVNYDWNFFRHYEPGEGDDHVQNVGSDLIE